MTTARDALERGLQHRLMMCSHDELRVLDVILVRLEIGRERYGLLDLTKPRDWERERAEELADAAIYQAARVLVDRDKLVASILSDVDDARPLALQIDVGLDDLRGADAIAVGRAAAVELFAFDMPEDTER